MEDEYKRISSVQELADTLNSEPNTAGQFFIQLGFGCRSWKVISWENSEHTKLFVQNEIDETEEIIDLAELESDKTILGLAIQKGQLYFAWF